MSGSSELSPLPMNHSFQRNISFKSSNEPSMTPSADENKTCGHLCYDEETGKVDGTPLYLFRTLFCDDSLVPGQCVEVRRCARSHCRTWQRRNPLEFSYVSEMCELLSFQKLPNGKQKLNKGCRRAQACYYSHSNEERLYHPAQYKTQLCYNELCGQDHPRRHYWCPFVHKGESLRVIPEEVKWLISDQLQHGWTNKNLGPLRMALRDPIFEEWYYNSIVARFGSASMLTNFPTFINPFAMMMNPGFSSPQATGFPSLPATNHHNPRNGLPTPHHHMTTDAMHLLLPPATSTGHPPTPVGPSHLNLPSVSDLMYPPSRAQFMDMRHEGRVDSPSMSSARVGDSPLSSDAPRTRNRSRTIDPVDKFDQKSRASPSEDSSSGVENLSEMSEESGLIKKLGKSEMAGIGLSAAAKEFKPSFYPVTN